MHLRDASNIDYNLSVPVERLPFQCVGPSVSRAWWEAGCPESWPLAAIFPDESCQSQETLQPVSLVVLMGDHGVAVGLRSSRASPF
eukprot:10810757-Heterocapsa_arctica.AAC.1